MRILEQANALHPVQAAVYLMSRLPYLQAFANGNKRTSRLAANPCWCRRVMRPFRLPTWTKPATSEAWQRFMS